MANTGHGLETFSCPGEGRKKEKGLENSSSGYCSKAEALRSLKKKLVPHYHWTSKNKEKCKPIQNLRPFKFENQHKNSSKILIKLDPTTILKYIHIPFV